MQYKYIYIDGIETDKNKKYKDIPDELKNKATELISNGIKRKYVKRILAKELDINEEAVRVFIRDYVK